MKFKLVVAFLFFTLDVQAQFLPKTFEADILQSYTSSMSKKERITKGKISYQFPSRLYFEVLGDEPVTYVSNPEKSWVYNPPFIEGEEGVVRESESTRHSFSKFFDTLSKGLADNELYTVKKEEKKAVLTFHEKVAEQISLASAELFFKTKIHEKIQLKDLEKIVLNYQVKRPPVTLKFDNYKENVRFKDNFFIFKIPAKTQVIKN